MLNKINEMRLDYYMKSKSSDKQELFKQEEIIYDDIDTNIDKIRILLVKKFRDKHISNLQYTIEIEKLKETIVSIFFEYDIVIKRDSMISKILN